MGTAEPPTKWRLVRQDVIGPVSLQKRQPAELSIFASARALGGWVMDTVSTNAWWLDEASVPDMDGGWRRTFDVLTQIPCRHPFMPSAGSDFQSIEAVTLAQSLACQSVGVPARRSVNRSPGRV